MEDQPTSDAPKDPPPVQLETEVKDDAGFGPPPSGDPTSTLNPNELGRQAPQAPSGQGVIPANAGWYNGPWPVEGFNVTESTGAAIGRTIIKSVTALIVLFGLPFLALMFLIFSLAGIGAASGGDAVEEEVSARYNDFVAGERSGDVRLVAVPVIGGIMGENRGGGGFLSSAAGLTFGYDIKQTLLDLAEDDDVDGVLLELDSPGGTIFGSKAIADGVAEYQEKTGKPVLAYVGGISASGGMYAMAGADEIVADHGTLIGSIGVIFGPFVRFNDVSAIDGGLFGGGVTTEGGIEYEFLTAGRHKDLGSPYRDMTAEERKTLEEGLDSAYDAFVAHVAVGRGLSESAIKNDLGALIFGEQQALSNGLIDTIGSREEAHQRLAELAGADGDDWRLDRAGSGDLGFFDLLSGSADAVSGSSEGGPGTLPSMCTGTSTMLTYHGDPASLCAPLLQATVAE